MSQIQFLRHTLRDLAHSFYWLDVVLVTTKTYLKHEKLYFRSKHFASFFF